ncbi:LCP family protein [Streptacidiphilus cavernicola]|uniref:LCP family protein n=1 Tax=Streptacidiphilus cavernicola TaxID=3342716 RepID=A0ABV6VWP9_9ACTN
MRRARRKPRRRWLKIVAWSLAVLVVASVGGGYYLYSHLAGNIKTAALYTGNDKAKAVGTEKADPLGRTPLNLLLIGSDTRIGAANCKDGGACKTAVGARADVEMLVHLSADRSNITVMSIPRDLYTQLPACTDPSGKTSTPGGFGQINGTLQYGPSCTAMAVHKLTGVPIDDFMMVDFSGVVSMSNALGGVNLCFTHRFYDINSGLKLTQGSHVLKGQAALQFLRTRDSFGDGSDNVGRTTATHVFFTQMINKLKNAGTITNIPAMLSIANAASNALTVSPDIHTPAELLDLARNLNAVKSDRITFTTMQNTPDTAPNMGSHVLQAAGAQTLFAAIANDQSLTTATGANSGAGSATAGASAGTAPAVKPADTAVSVWNGSGVLNRAGDIVSVLESAGYSHDSSANTDHTSPHPATSSLTYGPGESAQAKAVAAVLGLPAKQVVQGTAKGLKLEIGLDWTSGKSFPGSTPSKAPVSTSVALNNTHSQNGGKSECVQVSTQYTENKLGLSTGSAWNSPGETPEEMFDIYSKRPNSAP